MSDLHGEEEASSRCKVEQPRLSVGEPREGLRADSLGPPYLVTVEEAASLLRIGRTRTYEFIRCGLIQSVKVGRRRLVVHDSLRQFVALLVADQAT